ncbi:MAG: YebC/PmpR family DNA-binding transcriptional regulator [Deltaproteobacteria bacterium]|jgi:YebC/PmpR family DNA-binding regulatory protein|nr:YebC/PmpR family DNA-binding transcriptional regulator [Deltaproteobacteria bacterium]
MGAQWKQKHRELAANAKGRVMGKLVKELTIAARAGADPAMNPRLRMAVEAAKKASMARDTLERAIKKGSGQDAGAADQFDTVVYEGFAPHQVAVIVECLTDNKNRTATNIRTLFNKGGGQLGGNGSVSWDFDRLGAVEATAPSRPGLDPEEEAIEAGANELDPPDEDGTVTFYTGPTDLDKVAKALSERGWTVTSAKLIWKAKNPAAPEGDKRAQVEAFLEAVDGDDDVQAVFVALA